jgi:hypothetical protein
MPRQLLAVSRGCLAAYSFGVVVVWSGYLASHAQGRLHVFGPLSSLLVSMIYGALLASIVAVLVLSAWAGLAWLGRSVAWWTAPLTATALCASVIAALLGDADWSAVPAGLWIVQAAAFGAATGLVFWVAAFGRRSRVQMSFGV